MFSFKKIYLRHLSYKNKREHALNRDILFAFIKQKRNP
ncbi:hypothetical protein K708_1204 [Campylobacter coli JL-CDD-LMH]|nr:hypothetical protein K708_1204 [Campylobacter coli JL-CDD-LMH]